VHPNLSITERWVRGIAGALAVYMGTVTMGAGGWSTFAWAFGGLLALTAVAGYCPVYDRLGYNSLAPSDYGTEAGSTFRSVASGEHSGNRVGHTRGEATGRRTGEAGGDSEGAQGGRGNGHQSPGRSPENEASAPRTWQEWDEIYRRGEGPW
jgi:hypothetical protein